MGVTTLIKYVNCFVLNLLRGIVWSVTFIIKAAHLSYTDFQLCLCYIRFRFLYLRHLSRMDNMKKLVLFH